MMACIHLNLHFGSGDYHLFCHDCNQTWTVTDHAKANRGAATQLSGQARQAASHGREGGDGPVAWAVFAASGNIRLWSTDSDHVRGWAAQRGMVVTPLYAHAAQARQEPVARARITLQDDGPYAELEVLNGELLQPSMSPVDLYAVPVSEPTRPSLKAWEIERVLYAHFRADEPGETESIKSAAAELSVMDIRAPAQASGDRGDLTKIAAECHRAKWQFDLSEDYKPTAKVARAMILKAFDELHRIGDIALKLRSPSVPSAHRGGEA